jgi:hypothetical protein
MATTTFAVTGLPSPLVEVSSTNCFADLIVVGDGGNAASSVFVQDPEPMSGASRLCELSGTLADGTAVAATVTFTPATTGCCPGFTAVPSTFASVDAGADALGDRS